MVNAKDGPKQSVGRIPVFHSVVLAGVYDVRDIRRKLRPEDEHRENSPLFTAVQNAQMFGFVKVKNSVVLLANRIFEMRLYNKFLLDLKEQNRE